MINHQQRTPKACSFSCVVFASSMYSSNCRNARDNSSSDSVMVGGCSSREDSDSDPGPREIVLEGHPGGLLKADFSALDSAGTVVPSNDRKTAGDVWRDIIARKNIQQKPKEEMMTLEEFLLEADAVEETGTASTSTGVVGVKVESVDEDKSRVIGIGVGAFQGVRRKTSTISLDPLDKASLQRQKRMIKNRESAARSRERKQAYQVELETMAMRLEEENMQLVREKAERAKKRYKQLMENVIPLTEKTQASCCAVRRVRSTEW